MRLGLLASGCADKGPFEASFLHISQKELQEYGDDDHAAVKLADSEDIMGTLGVYHELHCLVSRIN